MEYGAGVSVLWKDCTEISTMGVGCFKFATASKNGLSVYNLMEDFLPAQACEMLLVLQWSSYFIKWPDFLLKTSFQAESGS